MDPRPRAAATAAGRCLVNEVQEPLAGEPSTLEDPRVIAALEEYLTELEAGAHPNREQFLRRHAEIVPVYAVGCERGVHYYAMQYIEGQSLATLIRSLKERGRNSLEETAIYWNRNENAIKAASSTDFTVSPEALSRAGEATLEA